MLSWSQRSRYCWLTRRIKYFSGILVVVSLVACSGDTSHSSADKKEITTTSDASQVSEAPQLTDLEIKSQLQGSSGSDDQHPGAAIYVESCATCHDSGVARAPARNIMELMSPNSMHRTLTEGIMRQQAATLSDLQKNQVVEYLVGTVQPEQAELKYCEGPSLDFDWSQHPTASGWGIDTKIHDIYLLT